MFVTIGSTHKEHSSQIKKAGKKRKYHHSDAAGDAAVPKAKPKKPRTELSQLQAPPTPCKDPIATPFKTVTTRLYLPLSPLYSLHPWLSLESDHLDPLILTYYPPLRGIILSYRNIRFNQGGARIQADSPFAFTWVTVDFLLWCPHKGDFLEGWVNLQSESHVGLLVLNTFNVSVPRGKIPGPWRWCEKRVGFTPARGKPVPEGVEGEEEETEEDLGGWVNEKGEYVDGLLRFKVETVKASGHIIAIEGNLLESEADAGQDTNTPNLGEARKLSIRPTKEADKIADEVGASAEPESPVKERKDKKDKERKKDGKKKKQKSKKDKNP